MNDSELKLLRLVRHASLHYTGKGYAGTQGSCLVPSPHLDDVSALHVAGYIDVLTDGRGAGSHATTTPTRVIVTASGIAFVAGIDYVMERL